MADAEKKLTLKIKGMTCASCAAKVEKALQGVEGVIEAGVNFAMEKATVRFKDSQASPADFKQAVKKSAMRLLTGPKQI